MRNTYINLPLPFLSSLRDYVPTIVPPSQRQISYERMYFLRMRGARPSRYQSQDLR